MKFSRDSDGEVDGSSSSSSDEETSKSIKVSQSVIKTATAQKVTREQNSSNAAAKKN